MGPNGRRCCNMQAKGEEPLQSEDNGMHVRRSLFLPPLISLPRGGLAFLSTLLVKASPGKVLNDVILAVTT